VGRTIEIAPSILSADFANLARDIERVEAGGADLLHLDLMDGHFVPNLTIGPPVVAAIRQATRLTLDAHLMVSEPARLVEDLAKAGANWISAHVETDPHLARTLDLIQSRGMKAGIAINPGTSLSSLEELLPRADFVLIMSVNPGFGGQAFIPSALQKIRKLREIITSYGYSARIEVDGGIGLDNLDDVLDAGADIIVAGSAIFKAAEGATAATRGMKEIADRHNRVLQTP
jgi:ribulose-phosphate 3-epimerase